MPAPRLILASRSPRRADMLRSVGVQFEVRTGECEELWRQGESPVEFAKRVTGEKLAACPRELTDGPGELRLAADTVVWMDDQDPSTTGPLGKPRDRAHAREMLLALQAAGQHKVTTAFALDASAHEDVPPLVQAVTTTVHFRQLHDDELEHYLDHAQWADKAGAYGIQAEAASFVTKIEGSYTNVVGLPLAEVVQALRTAGVLRAVREEAIA